VSSPDAGRLAVDELRRFYRWNAPLYDWTRPFILWGRAELIAGLGVRPHHHVLDIGCGTGWSFPRLAAAGARITGVEPSPEMRARAAHRAAGLAATANVVLDDAPFGGDDRYRGAADRVIFSYSLSMIPPFSDVLGAARAALKPGGRLGVVDFLDAAPGVREWLEVSHVALGGDRLEMLRGLFPKHGCHVRRGAGWRYFVFWGNVES
jgi:S-adenosylmethionine-diacylgycerolhomoserine-N-methlytransferase